MEQNTQNIIIVPHMVHAEEHPNSNRQMNDLFKYIPDLLCEVTNAGMPAILDLHVVDRFDESNEFLNIKAPLIPLNFNTDNPDELQAFAEIAHLPETVKQFHNGIKPFVLQKRCDKFTLELHDYITTQLCLRYLLAKGEFEPVKPADFPQTERLMGLHKMVTPKRVNGDENAQNQISSLVGNINHNLDIYDALLENVTFNNGSFSFSHRPSPKYHLCEELEHGSQDSISSKIKRYNAYLTDYKKTQKKFENLNEILKQSSLPENSGNQPLNN